MPDDNDLDPIDPAAHAAAVARATAAERELAFARAGVPLSGALADLFRNGYAGPLEPERIEAAWAEVQPPPPPVVVTPPEGGEPTVVVPPGGTELEQRQGLAAEGLIPAETEDPLDVIMREANPRDIDVQRVGKGVKKLTDAFFAGDQRVTVAARQAARVADYVDPAP